MSSGDWRWDMALEEIARTLRPDDPTTITETKAIRKAILAPDEAVTTYITLADHEAVILWLLTNCRRLVRLQFIADRVRHRSFPFAQITFLGGDFEGATSRMTEVAGFDAVRFQFVIHDEMPIELTLPVNRPNCVAGREEIAFAQQLLGALFAQAAG
ncbi:MAG: hypothetical protein LC793_04215 [Thermomicrobia bacterium]|nr:hypothetical protein [Thermomicrobia bacterium]MCA1724715.1 hypothetical protein [Thermomicrobia bacterium]